MRTPSLALILPSEAKGFAVCFWPDWGWPESNWEHPKGCSQSMITHNQTK